MHGDNMKKYCIDCGKEISTGSKKGFCHVCASTGDRNGFFKGGLPKCLDCGKELINYRSKRCYSCSKKGDLNPKFKYYNKTVFCIVCNKKLHKDAIYNKTIKCKSCSQLGRIQAKPKKMKYKKIWFRSSWEVKYAKYLDKSGIKWQYEPKVFDLGNCTYTPDFYLPKTKEYIEIKGRWFRNAKEKIRLFKKIYKSITIKVFMKEDLIDKKILNRRGY